MYKNIVRNILSNNFKIMTRKLYLNTFMHTMKKTTRINLKLCYNKITSTSTSTNHKYWREHAFIEIKDISLSPQLQVSLLEAACTTQSFINYKRVIAIKSK